MNTATTMVLYNWIFHVLLIFAAMVRGKLYRECIGFVNDQKYVASQDDCGKYIYCDGKNSFEGACLGDNYFNVKEGKCDERASIVCKVGQQSTGEVGSGGASSDGLRVDPVNAYNNNNYNIDNNIVGNWNVLGGQWMSQEQQLLDGFGGGIVGSEAVTGLALNAIDVGNTGSSTSMAQTPLCPRRYGLENVIYMPNTQSCAAYYVCYNGIAIPMICPRHSYFNQETSHCERENNMYCPVSCVFLLQFC